MPLYVARRAPRKGLLLEMDGTREKPNLLFFLPKMEGGHLDELVRSELQKQGITNESDVKGIISKAESDYEKRIKVQEARKEIRRLMDIRRSGGSLMQMGFRRWKQVFYPSPKRTGIAREV